MGNVPQRPDWFVSDDTGPNLGAIRLSVENVRTRLRLLDGVSDGSVLSVMDDVLILLGGLADVLLTTTEDENV